MANLKKWREKAQKKHQPKYCVHTGTCEFKCIEKEALGVYQIKCLNHRELCTKQTTVPQRIRIPFGC
jgi:hypothetical protein